MSLTRRSMLQAVGGGGTGPQVDVLYGTAAAEAGKLTLPIPDGYCFYVWMTDYSDKTSTTEIARKGRDPVGTITDKTNVVNRTYDAPNYSAQGVTRYTDYLEINGSNGNSYGTFVAGVSYTYIAWKETGT